MFNARDMYHAPYTNVDSVDSYLDTQFMSVEQKSNGQIVHGRFDSISLALVYADWLNQRRGGTQMASIYLLFGRNAIEMQSDSN